MSFGKHYTYKEWLEAYDITEEFEECSECNGDGDHECDCGDIHDCKACNGIGQVSVQMEEYETYKRDTEKRLREWEASIK